MAVSRIDKSSVLIDIKPYLSDPEMISHVIDQLNRTEDPVRELEMMIGSEEGVRRGDLRILMNRLDMGP